ncbi:MAG: hypothetical protein JNL58_27705 [Planctomyces sp.]|nr:hypothetical protein [Planctomyces sp.]
MPEISAMLQSDKTDQRSKNAPMPQSRVILTGGDHRFVSSLAQAMGATHLPAESVSENAAGVPIALNRCSELIVLPEMKLSRQTISLFRSLSAIPFSRPVRCVCLLPSLAAHYGDLDAIELENFVRLHLQSWAAEFSLIRTGHPEYPGADIQEATNHLWYAGLLPHTLARSVSSIESMSEIVKDFFESGPDTTMADPLSRAARQELTLLSPRKPLVTHDRPNAVSAKSQASNSGGGFVRRAIAGIMLFLGRLGMQQFIWILAWMFSTFSPLLRELTGQPIRPTSHSDLLRLYNPWNRTTLQTVGMNIGVRHFGWLFPGKTLVQTTGIRPAMRRSRQLLRVSAGAILKYCVQFLRAHHEQLLVVPNFTWISAGTSFFVPIHGSGSTVSTLGESIVSVLMFDGQQRRFIRAQRGDGRFEELMYRPDPLLLLLRMQFRTETARWYSRQVESLKTPHAETLWDLLFQSHFSHMEIRKKSSQAATVDIHRYQPVETSEASGLEIPRDQIGQIWDRIEETPVISTLFHVFVRRYAFHVELFLDRTEFIEFWQHHQQLPLLKIQLRRVNADGIRHSPFCSEDRISADLFMKKDTRDVFCSFVRQHIPNVRWNPGKQSF